MGTHKVREGGVFTPLAHCLLLYVWDFVSGVVDSGAELKFVRVAKLTLHYKENTI